MRKIKKWIAGILAVCLCMGNLPVQDVKATDSDELSVVSLEATPVEFIEETGGSVKTRENPKTGEMEEYYYYWMIVQPGVAACKFTVTFSDGTTLDNLDTRFTYNGKTYDISVTSTQDEEPWGVGEHVATATLLGCTTEINVSVVESPVVSFECEDIEIIENTEGYFVTAPNGTRLYQYAIVPKYKITFSDGTIQTGQSTSIFYDGKYYTNTTHYRQLTKGTHTIETTFMGHVAEFDVTIVESPLQNIVFDNIEIFEKTNGYYATTRGGETYYCYNLEDLFRRYSDGVTFTDGTTQKWGLGPMLWVQYKDNYYHLEVDRDQSTNPLEIGVNNIDILLLGKRMSVPVTIKADPIANIQISDVEIIEEDTLDWSRNGFDWSQLAPKNVEVTFKDGTVNNYTPEPNTCITSYNKYENSLFKHNDTLFSVVCTIPSSTPLTCKAGDQITITATIAGAETTYTINIIEASGSSWKLDGNGWWYCRADGSWPSNGWYIIDGHWYYFNASGYRLENQWVGDYYVNEEGVMVTNQWVGNYYVDGSGAYIARAGWLKIDANWYYLGKGGVRQTGWQCVNGTWYYLDSNGKMASNTWIDSYWVNQDGAWIPNETPDHWVQVGNRWWYRHTGGGYTTNAWELIDGKWYHFDADGWMQYGWLQLAGKWYYLGDSNDGAMKTNQWVGDYYVGADGVMATNQWIGKYYVDNTGKWDSTKICQ